MEQLKKIEHIGIAVKNLKTSNVIYTKLLGSKPYKEETVSSENVTTSFFKTGDSKIELLMATDPSSPIAKFIEKRGEGMHHIAFLVNDLNAEIIRLKNEGFTFVSETPKVGADNKRIVFVHPKDCSGVLIELCEEINQEK